MSNLGPIFGQVENGIQYEERPGAYAFLLNEKNHLAIIETSFGFFLPGGGIDPGETELEGLRRELFEEIGHRLLTAKLVTRATQFHRSEYYKKHFKKIGLFYLVATEAPVKSTLQDEHLLHWLPQEKAARMLSQEFQRWAVIQPR